MMLGSCTCGDLVILTGGCNGYNGPFVYLTPSLVHNSTMWDKEVTDLTGIVCEVLTENEIWVPQFRKYAILWGIECVKVEDYDAT